MFHSSNYSFSFLPVTIETTRLSFHPFTLNMFISCITGVCSEHMNMNKYILSVNLFLGCK